MSKFGILDGKNDLLCFPRIADGNGERTAMARQGMQGNGWGGDDAKRDERAGDELWKIVARNILDDFAAAGGERAVSKSYRDADDEVALRLRFGALRDLIIGVTIALA